MLGAQARIVRVMPNTPSLIGEGFSAYALNERCTGHDEEATRHILAACGKAQGVPEKLMDAVTGLSGSGPAYVYLFVEALIEAGVTAGLPLQVAREAAVQTLLGAGHMIRETGEDPAVLKRRVMSPGGTTVEGLRALEHAGLRSAVIEAVRAAAVRSAELGA
jgi:pyrroline-5-carboxylate reductase